MRFIVSVVATLAMFLAATAATASVDLSVTGVIVTGANAGSNDLTLAAVGDQIQLDINVLNTGNTIAGATFSASNIGGLQFDGGKSAATWFNEGVGKAYGNPIGGMANIRGTAGGVSGSYTSWVLPNNLGAAEIINGAVQFFSGADPGAPKIGTGALDLGILDGNVVPGGATDVGFVDNAAGKNGSAGASHARLFFTLLAPGQTIVLIGQGPNDGLVSAAGDEILNGTQIAVGVIPEPATALLMGLGLGGLSLAGRRRA